MLSVPALRQVRPVADQARLDAAGRQANLAGALGVVPGWRRTVRDARVLLVDDVVTTGATLWAAADALHLGGADVLGAVAVARTPLRRQERAGGRRE
ncbi:hypothetical protein GCM10025868_37020 [Angustibacter aerolatus]|uniref:Phosphoribosyltransferase domain-containing protein n=1 Tax=Angustibacter aerolatus TaxID=1162965 RepID=A0ABQ6JJM6_9ACTN|nr:hypothetical protein GCM10025868_37020 [Angustibacter aerolatus]